MRAAANWSAIRRIGLQALAALVVALGLGGCGADPEQARLCTAAIGAFDDKPGLAILGYDADPAVTNSVRVRWRPAPGDAPRSITCAFAGGSFDPGRLDLVRIDVEGRGALTEAELFWLQRWLALPSELLPVRPTAGSPDRDPMLPFLYGLQQLINAMSLTCVYALLAIGFTLVYAVIGQINFAFGGMAMLAAIASVLGSSLLAVAAPASMPSALLLILALSALIGGMAAWVSDRLVFRKLRGAATHVPLIAAVGLALLLQEGARLLQGAGDLWVQPSFTRHLTLAGSPTFDVVLSLPQLILLLLTLLSGAALLRMLVGTRFGLELRACAADRATAALLGVDVDRTISRSFMLGGAFAGLAGFVIVQYYGVANFFMGMMLGFKALAAAIIGGIGSVPGAMLGAAVVAGLEILWSAYFDLAGKDIAVFGLLTLTLVFRPAGLLGKS